MKIEILFCIGNFTLGIKDCLFIEGLHILKDCVEQGALHIITKAIDFKQTLTDKQGLRVALNSLHQYFKIFK